MTTASTRAPGWAALLGVALVTANACSREQPAAAPPPPAVAAPKPATPPESRPEITAEQERDLYLSKLRATGAAEGAWTAQAAGVFDHWRRLGRAAGKAAVEHSATECFREGCTMTLRYRRGDLYQSQSDLLPRTDPFKSWPGGSWRSGPVSRAGLVESTWILLSPSPPLVAQRKGATP